MKKIAFAFCLFALPAHAQDAASNIRAIPSLINQRNNALDALALCGGDVTDLRNQLALANKKIEELKKAAAVSSDSSAPKP